MSPRRRRKERGPWRPNLFMVGAPKCGTTALYMYLASHPDVFAGPKEPHYFGQDLSFSGRMSSDDYRSSFAGAGYERYRLDASVLYLYSGTAAQEIFAFDPQAKIIIMLRDPVDMIVSMHQHLVFKYWEDITDLGSALAAEPDRVARRRVPRACDNVDYLLYRSLTRFRDQVERYLRTFPTENVCVMFYEEFFAEPNQSYHLTLEFLDLPDDGREAFPVVNPGTKSWRYPYLQYLATTKPGHVETITSLIPLFVRQRVGALMDRFNERPTGGKSPNVPAGLLEALRDQYVQENFDLEQLLGRRPPWSSGSESRRDTCL
jgi:hypothetical protein